MIENLSKKLKKPIFISNYHNHKGSIVNAKKIKIFKIWCRLYKVTNFS